MRIPAGAAEVDDQPQRRRALSEPAIVTRTVSAVADVGRRGVQLLAMGLVLGGAATITVTRDPALGVPAIVALGVGGYLLGLLHTADRPSERDLAVDRAVVARREADLNRVLLSFAVLGRDGPARGVEQVQPRSAGSEPRPTLLPGGPPRRLGLVDLDPADRAELGLDDALPGEGDEAGEAIDG